MHGSFHPRCIHYDGEVWWLCKSGYYCNTDGQKLHRTIYEDNFGSIPKGYDVHHKDHDRCNNSPENLEAMDLRQRSDVQRAARCLSQQLSPQAHFAVRRLIRRVGRCRYAGARIAPVLGRRFSMTRNLKIFLAASEAQDQRGGA